MTKAQQEHLRYQRTEAVTRVIRYGGGFGGSKRKCAGGCGSTLTAKAPDGRWACPWCWPVTQLELAVG